MIKLKIIHCADIHADSKMGTHFTKEQASNLREEIIDTFENMVLFAKNNDVKVIIIAGDLFDTKETRQKKIKQRIGYIISQAPQIDFLYLRGNHDEDVVFMPENLSNLKRFEKNKWSKYSYKATDSDFTVDIYGTEFSSKIPVSIYENLAVDTNHVNIVTLHGQVSDYNTQKNDAPVINLPKFKNKNIDYIALGHIHSFKYEKLDSRGSWCYSGCLEGRGFDECGDKGFVLIDINENSKSLSVNFCPAAKRKIHEIDIELKDFMTFDEILASITEKLMDIPYHHIVQVCLRGEISEDTEIETESYESILKSRFFFIRIKDFTETKIDYEKYENDVSLKGEFIRLVKKDENLSDEEKSKIIITGIKALAGRLKEI